MRVRRWMDLFAAVLMASATTATAWSAYQSSLWGGEHVSHTSQSITAVVRVGKLSSLAMQRTAVHVSLFVAWVSATHAGDSRLADFLFARFPEPLKTAAGAWRAQKPTTNPEAPASPFDMPEYVLQERIEADRWEEIAQRESAAAENANEAANRYLLFTIIYATVLFLAGISGKFRRPAIDLAVLVLGALTLVVGLVIMLSSPRL